MLMSSLGRPTQVMQMYMDVLHRSEAPHMLVDLPHTPRSRCRRKITLMIYASFADASFADASFADASFADASIADASIADASFADASIADVSIVDASFAVRRSIPMWSLTSDHTHCFLKIDMIKSAKVAGLVTYSRGYAGRARAAHPKYGTRCYYRTYGHTHNSVTSRTSSTQGAMLPTS
jgi:hypothetical protein